MTDVRAAAAQAGFDPADQARLAAAAAVLEHAGATVTATTADGELRIEAAGAGAFDTTLVEGVVELRREGDRLVIAEPLRGRPATSVADADEVLLRALAELRALNRELEDTNRGVVALYAELDERADRLRDADERKSRFLADMSHELRTPLNSIVALADLLLQGNPPIEGESRTQVGLVKRTAEDQLRLIGDLLDIAKIEAGRVVVEVGDVAVPELFALLRAQLRPLTVDSPVELRFETEAELPVLRTDEGKLVQVLRNLVANALKFTRAGTITVSAHRDGERVELTVRDTGVGIAPEDLDRIFEEFVQLPGAHQRRGSGTGLGLPLSRKLVNLLGGGLDVSSTPGSGSTFRVRLPVVPTPGAAEVPDPSGALLVVDDDEAARLVLRAHLRDTGWEIVEVSGGREALAACERGTPEGIVLDLAMPDMDGVEVLARLRADHRLRQVPVVVHTSRLLDAPNRGALEAHGAVVLDKSRTSRVALIEALSAATGGMGLARG